MSPSLNSNQLLNLTLSEKLALLATAGAEQLRLNAKPETLFAEYDGDPIRFITEGLGQAREPSWANWLVILKAAFCQPLNKRELAIFTEISGGRSPPRKRVRELWAIMGRRSGKDSVASMIATYIARYADTSRLRLGEEAIVACLATNRDQAEIVWKYIRGYFEAKPELRAWLRVPRMVGGRILLKNRVEIRVATNNYRSPRGWPVAVAILDEVAFYRSEDSATPDFETYNALRPGMATIPGSMIIGISSPHKQSGLLYQKFEEHYGKDDDEVLVIKAPTRVMNPMIDQLEPGLIDKALAEDPESASAEWFAEFRRDLADYVSREVVNAAINRGVYELEPQRNIRYAAFTDPSGGSRDSFTLAIAHLDTKTGRGVLDCLRERRSPFKPAEVCAEYAAVLETYGLRSVRGDRYAGVWPTEQFAQHGVIYEASETTKSDIYRDFLPLMNSSRIELLDVPRMHAQLLGLERRTVRGGRDSIDHTPGAYDDLANATAGVLLMVAGDDRKAVVSRYLRAFGA